MIIRRILNLIPDKFTDYDYVSQFLPKRIKAKTDVIVNEYIPKISAMRKKSVVEANFRTSDTIDEESALNNEGVEKKRQNLVKNMTNDEGQFPKNFTDKAREQSLKDHQAESAFSASSVNGAGNTGGKLNSNMAHRNFTH